MHSLFLYSSCTMFMLGTDQIILIYIDYQWFHEAICVLFCSYFQESVVERREEQYRVRPCIVYFYLEDDSIQVVEPRQKNAGLPQGTLIRRHRYYYYYYYLLETLHWVNACRKLESLVAIFISKKAADFLLLFWKVYRTTYKKRSQIMSKL